jgi:hypothetical protein
MTIVRTSKYNVIVPGIFEDPAPSSDKIFFQKETYAKSDLRHFFNKTISFNIAGTGFSNFGYSDPNVEGVLGGILQLADSVTHVRHFIENTQNDYRNNMDLSPFISMDPLIKIRPNMYFTNGTQNCVLSYYHWHNGSTWRTWFVRKVGFTAGQDLSDVNPDNNTYWGDTFTVFPLFRAEVSNHVVAVCYNHTSNYAMAVEQGARLTNCFSTSSPALERVGYVNGRSCQYVGRGQSNYAIFLHNNVDNDVNQLFYRYNDSTNATTTLTTFSANPAAGGTSAGGARTQGGSLPKFASKTFTDPNNAALKGFYLPYLDSANKYHPHYMQWNTSNDTFTRNTDITIAYPGSTTQANYWDIDTVSGSSTSNNYGMQRCWYNETFVKDGNRYLTLMQLHGAGGVYDSSALRRSFVTYSINASNPKQLTYHSNVVIPATPKNICFLNDERTSLAVITASSMYVYNFDSTNGWTLLTTLNYKFYAVGRDSLGRIWSIDRDSLGHARSHVIEGLGIPASVSVIPQTAAEFNFTGTASDAAFLVNAYDRDGRRMISNVTLEVAGSSLRLVNGSSQQVTTLQVTTSASADTVVPVKVIAAGQSEVEAYVNF